MTSTNPRRRTARTLLASALLLALGVVAAPSAGATVDGEDEPGDDFPLFDFADRYYTKNGIRVDALLDRRTGKDGLSVPDRAPSRDYRDVRVLWTLPTYGHSGDTVFYSIFADLAADPFTDNAAGREAKEIADSFPIYVFPRMDGDPLGFGNNKQASVIEDRHGYFSNNPLGLWKYLFVNWTDAAFDTPEGRKALKKLKRQNGLGSDGTPIVTEINDIEDLEEDGFVTIQERPDGDRQYFVCPAYKDPRNGAIKRDAILDYTFDDKGKPLKAEKHFIRDFKSLQRTGDWHDD